MFTDVITTVCEKLANSIGFVYWPCIRLHDRIHGCGQAVYIAVYTARYTPRVHSLYTAVPYTATDAARIYNTALYATVYTAVYTGRVRIYVSLYVYMFVYTAVCHGRLHGRVQIVNTARTRVHGRIHGRVCIRPVYTAVCGP